jgi:VanZ family protein
LVVIEINAILGDDPMRALRRFLPPILWMGVIFALSAQPNLGTGLGGWDYVLRKLAHMTEYGILWLLWSRALGEGRRALAAAIAIAYAATDEFHQTFVGGRHGTPVDVAIDAVGVALAWALTTRTWEWGARLEAERPPNSQR